MEAGGNGRLFGQALQYRNEGGKLDSKSGESQSHGGGWEWGVSKWRMKRVDPENIQTVGRVLR